MNSARLRVCLLGTFVFTLGLVCSSSALADSKSKKSKRISRRKYGLSVTIGENPFTGASDIRYSLKSSTNGRSYELKLKKGKYLPYNTGTTLQITGALLGTTVTADPVDTAIIPIAVSETNLTGTRRVLAILADFSDKANNCAQSDVYNIMNGATPPTVNGFYQEVSRGTVAFSTVAIGKAKLGMKSTVCDRDGWAKSLEDYAYFTGYRTAGYDHVMYVLPYTTACPGAAYGDIGGKRTWFFGCTGSEFVHELGHNLGMRHAGSPTNDYGDGYDPMGIGLFSHFNDLHKQAMGWIPAANIQIASGPGSYTLSPLELPQSGILQSLKVGPASHQYSLSLRTNAGYDALYPSPQTNAVEIHQAGAGPNGTSDTMLLDKLYRYFSTNIFDRGWKENLNFKLVGAGMHLLLLSISGDSASITLSPMTVAGTVVSKSGVLRSGYKVNILAVGSATTDSNGRFSIQTPYVGNATMSICPPGLCLLPYLQLLHLGDDDMDYRITF